MTSPTVHKSQQNFEAAILRVQTDPEVCAENKPLIISFAKTRLARGTGKLRVVKTIYALRFLSHWLHKPFGAASKDDVIELVGTIENTDYAAATKHDFKVILKIFYRWLKGDDETNPPETKWLKPRLNHHAHKLPEELLTEDEVFRIAEAADHPRNKAMVLVLYETGCRIGELLSLRMKNVIVDQHGAILRMTGKTGDRRVRIISSAPTLAAWVNIYAKRNDPEAPLWPPLSTNYLNKPSKMMDYRSAYAMIKELAQKANVHKRIYPHLFRHSRATFMAGKLTEAQMKEYFGWTQGSIMAATYVHLSGRDVDNALFALQGMSQLENKKEEKFKICLCPRCKEKNSPIAKFCLRCGTPMDIQVTSQIQQEQQNSNQLLNTLMQDAEFKTFLLQKVTALGLDKTVVGGG